MAEELTPNRLVALNLVGERTARGWTQARAAEELSKHGHPWSKQLVSNSEKSASEHADTRDAGRTFTPDDLLAMARTFQRSLSWFFLPPDGHDPELTIKSEKGGAALKADEYVGALFENHADLFDRVKRNNPVDATLKMGAEDFIVRALVTRLKEYGDETIASERDGWQAVIDKLETVQLAAAQLRDAVPDDPLEWLGTPEGQRTAERGRQLVARDSEAARQGREGGPS